MFPEYSRGIISMNKYYNMEIVTCSNCRRFFGRWTTGIDGTVLHFRDNNIYVTFEHYHMLYKKYVRSNCVILGIPVDLETLPKKVCIRNDYLVKPISMDTSKIFQK